MLFKIAKKLHLHGPLRAALLPLVKAVSRSPLSLSAENAEALLSVYSPDPGSSAFFPGEAAVFKPDYDLDIIVPVYNVEQYLERCAESILSQKTAYSFRVIFVDDGATDNSGKLLDQYADLPNVLVIHQENQGFSGARNRALSLVNSRYLMFVDSDDILPQGAVEKMLSAAFQHRAAMVQGCFATFHGAQAPVRDLSMGCGILIDPPADRLPGYAWAKVIASKYFQHLRFPEGYWFEDSISAQILYALIRKDKAPILGIDDIVYHYQINPKGISMQAVRKIKSIDSFFVTRQLHKDRDLFSLAYSQDYYEYLLDNICLTYERTKYLPKDVREALLVLWNTFLAENFPDFHTCRKGFDALETAIRDKNFAVYSLCCRLL